MVSVAMSNNAQSTDLMQPLPQGASRAPQRSYSWTHDGPLPLNNDNTTRRFSAFSTPTPKPVESTFWKNSGKVPGSIKAIKTPPRAFMQPAAHVTPTTTAHTTSDSSSNTSNSHTTQSTPNQNQPPKSQPSSQNNSPETSPSPQRVATASRSKSTSSIPEKTLSSASLTSSSNGFGEFVHHCMEWKSCGRIGETTKLDRFKKILSDPVIDMENLKKNCWKGVPGEVRSQCWKLLLGYLPANADRRESTLARKRKEYHDNVDQYYRAAKTENEAAILKQIQIDLPRTNPKMPLFQQVVVQNILERILYIWAIRHPASDYVQGINDISTPFFVVFLSEFVDNVDSFDASKSGGEFLSNIEADTYWCLSKFLDGIQDYYTFAQPGIQRMTFKLHELVGRVDQPLTRHLQANEVQFIDFSFRWMNCVLVREFPLPLVARMWDTYLAEGESFSIFHLYVCAAFLKRWSAELRLLDFQEIFMFLQRPPTNDWTCKDIELMLSEAYLWMETFQNAPAHLKSSIA
eukprot:Phypoly_transcript_05403.p1 GENE.Phypoly_transcript_05403~~Phypoly_transcript_05403.p1  ORF type:complete len:517 (+),score=51.34 Phypoly_transcript_05403:136-1686(+)